MTNDDDSDNVTVGRREQFVVGAAEGRAPDPSALCGVVMDVLRTTCVRASVDAYSDFAEMPPDIHAAEAWLRDRGLTKPEGDPGLGIEVAPTDEVGWTLARAYAPWASRIVLFGADGANIATLQHGGQFITVNLTPDLVPTVALALAPAATLAPLATSDDAGDSTDRLDR
jgi:hypothetical protein